MINVKITFFLKAKIKNKINCNICDSIYCITLLIELFLWLFYTTHEKVNYYD